MGHTNKKTIYLPDNIFYRRRFTLASIALVLLASCDGIKNKAKQAINKTGEAVGTGSSEFVKGVSKGVEQTLESEITLSDDLKQQGISFGRFTIGKAPGTESKNMLTVYLIFAHDFNGNISARITDNSGTEYGRSATTVSAKANETKYADFIFDKRTDIESKSKFILY
ncbi:MAG: hypothetical protein V4649_18255 [Bacteroidota bacterium]